MLLQKNEKSNVKHLKNIKQWLNRKNHGIHVLVLRVYKVVVVLVLH